MDSLLANYASSDEDDEQTPQPQSSIKPSLSLFSSLPKPQSSSSKFPSLPPPKSSSQLPKQQDSSLKSSSLFSNLPPPKSDTTTDLPIPLPNPKRVVQFRPPVPLPSSNLNQDDEDDEEDEEDEKEKERNKQREISYDTSVKSFLSSMPTPKSSGLGSAPFALGSGRKSIVETEVPSSAPSNSDHNEVTNGMGFGSNVESNQEHSVDGTNVYGYAEVGVVGDQAYASYGGYNAYGSSTSDYGSSYEGYGHYDSSNNWYNASSGDSGGSLMPAAVESFSSLGGKRRRDQPPPEVIEVKQDELMKNRPKEDKSKLTGIAFGPSYQPVSNKGKPSKLHKRKHQIGSLYFDMRQKEMELQERRAKGFLTKAETQAKYGW
ncbi:unnamed protein product [Amaranthus hypochondriacus]